MDKDGAKSNGIGSQEDLPVRKVGQSFILKKLNWKGITVERGDECSSTRKSQT